MTLRLRVTPVYITELFDPCATCEHLGWSHDNAADCAECDCEHWTSAAAMPGRDMKPPKGNAASTEYTA